MSVAAFVSRWSGPLDILVNNAGIMATPELRTKEAGAPIRHQPPRALRSHDRTARRPPGCRTVSIVVVSSVGHVNGEVLFERPRLRTAPVRRVAAYSQSKTANILFAVEAAKRWASDGIAVNALNPGRIADTNLSRHMETPPATFDPKGSTGVS